MVTYHMTDLDPYMSWIPTAGGIIPISTNRVMPPGIYPITVIGSANGVTHQASGTVIVKEGVTPVETITTTVDSTPTVTPPTPTSIETTTVIEPTTVTVIETPTSTETQTPAPTPLLTGLGGSFPFLIIGLLIAAVVVLALVLTRKRYPFYTHSRTYRPFVYCPVCGARGYNSISGWCPACGYRRDAGPPPGDIPCQAGDGI